MSLAAPPGSWTFSTLVRSSLNFFVKEAVGFCKRNESNQRCQIVWIQSSDSSLELRLDRRLQSFDLTLQIHDHWSLHHHKSFRYNAIRTNGCVGLGGSGQSRADRVICAWRYSNGDMKPRQYVRSGFAISVTPLPAAIFEDINAFYLIYLTYFFSLPSTRYPSRFFTSHSKPVFSNSNP